MVNLDSGNENLAKKNKLSNLKLYIGAWGGTWESDMASTIILWIECTSMLYSNRVRKNTHDIYVVQIRKFEKKHA